MTVYVAIQRYYDGGERILGIFTNRQECEDSIEDWIKTKPELERKARIDTYTLCNYYTDFNI